MFQELFSNYYVTLRLPEVKKITSTNPKTFSSFFFLSNEVTGQASKNAYSLRHSFLYYSLRHNFVDNWLRTMASNMAWVHISRKCPRPDVLIVRGNYYATHVIVTNYEST